MTLVEVLIGIGLVSLVFVAVAQMIGYFTTTTQTFRRSVVRDNIQQRVSRFFNLPQQLRNSIAAGPYTIPGLSSSFPDNTELRECINAGGSNDCNATGWRGFTLVDGSGSSPLPVAGSCNSSSVPPCPGQVTNFRHCCNASGNSIAFSELR